MKHTIKKMLSVLLSMIMVFSALPVHVLAATDSDVTDGVYTDGVWAAEGNGSITHNIDGTDITLSKTAVPVEGQVNTYDITLEVKTSTSQHVETGSGAVVLVMDISNSMDYCASCGGDGFHISGCAKIDNILDWVVNSGDTRIAAAKSAALSFLSAYAGEDANAQRELAIVLFGDDSEVVLQWSNVAGGAGNNSYDAAVTAINDMSTSGGTNLEAGLKSALDQLSASAVSDIELKNVVLLTDGAPTYRIDGGSGDKGSAENNNAAKNQADAIKELAKLYTVCFGAARNVTYSGGPTVSEFLKNSIASPVGTDDEGNTLTYAYDADDAAALATVFAAITQSITEGLDGQGWTATDPMPDYIDVTGAVPENFVADGSDYTWHLSDPEITQEGDTTYYTYTLTYRIVLDVQVVGFEEGKFYPTNEITTLNIEGAHYAFPVPGVKGVLPRTDISVSKVWQDDDDRDDLRTDAVTLQLKKDGVALGDPVVLSDANGWSYTWVDLIEKSGGVEHAYTVEELNVPAGYTPSYTVEGTQLTVTNIHNIKTTDITATKVWNDANDQDGLRPDSITVNLLADGEVVETATVSEKNGWKVTFEGMPVNKAGANGQAIEYTLAEMEVPEGYSSAISGYVVTNTHTPAKVDVSGSKTWEDDDNRDGLRPDAITVNLMADGTKVASKTVTANDGWAWSFTDLPKFASGVEIKYAVVEEAVAEYTTSVDGYNITNIHIPATQSLTVTKVWDDADNQDGLRPESIQVQLYADGVAYGDPVTLTADGWTYTWEDLFVKDAGKDIAYTVEEVNVPDGYKADVDGLVITNKHDPAVTSISGYKQWNDDMDRDGLRPDSITVILLADGVAVDRVTVSAESNWAYSFANLPVNKAGQPISYTIDEIEVADYTTKIEGYNIINTHEIAVVAFSGSKTWNDADDQDGIRPESITVNLLADGEVVETATVSEADGWSWSFEDLPKYRDHGTEIVYTVTEEAVAEYETTINGFNITNAYTPETTEVAGSKTWIDANDQDGVRPERITVNLLADGVKIDSAVVGEADGWSWSFEDLPKYRDHGTEIVYTVTEEAVAEYETTINGFNITNAYTPETTEVAGSKTWNDADDQDGIRPESITVNLLADGEVVETATVSEADGWSWSFENLPKYRDHGTEIVYTITEEAVAEYETTINGFNITNAYTPETVEVAGEKVWNDDDDRDGLRPEAVVIELLADGSVIDSAQVTEAQKWSFRFQDLPKYKDHGVEIEYTVREKDVPADYTSLVRNYVITNTHNPDLIDLTVKKQWVDADDQDGLRPESIQVQLYADGVAYGDPVTLTADGWTYTWEDLFVKAAGKNIAYTVKEVAVPGGYAAAVEGMLIVNTHEPAVVSVEGSKTWNDADDQDGIRPESITVNLLADGVKIDSAVVGEADGWSWSFEDLPKYRDHGTEIVYTVTEEAVENYTAAVNGFDITNTYTPEIVVVAGSKTWNDADDQDGIRPESITVNLLADGEKIDSAVVGEADGWSWSFENLPKYKDHGTEIVYTVTEEAVEKYTAAVNGFNITNTYAPETTQVSGSKTWNDADDQDGIRPERITVNLLADGEKIDSAVVGEADGWSWSFEDLPKYRDHGTEIVYTVTEEAVAEYETTIDGFNITNAYTPETIEVAGVKTWVDDDNRDGLRPETVTIQLLADGVVIEAAEITEAQQWSYSFQDLPKYRDHGTEIVYTVQEQNIPEGYTAEVEGFDITNTHDPALIDLTVNKAWDDADDQDGKRPEFIEVQLFANGQALGEAVKLQGEDWTYTWEGLFVKEAGVDIVYTVEEVAVPDGYEATVEGMLIINTHAPELISISGSKTWDDADDQDGIRPESVTVNLLANGQEVAEAVVTAESEWTWTFAELPKYAAGQEIVYTVTEDAVEGYTAVVEGFNITNTHIPSTVSVNVEKVWVDDDDSNELRPGSITVVLMANGEATSKSMKLGADSAWEGTFAGLPEFAYGEKIVYTVEELKVENYSTSISGNAADGFVITNELVPIPATGDDTNVVLYGMLMGISGMALAAIFMMLLNDKKRAAK